MIKACRFLNCLKRKDYKYEVKNIEEIDIIGVKHIEEIDIRKIFYSM